MMVLPSDTKNKQLVMILSDGSPNQINNWVKRMADRCMQQMDWNYQGGRAMIWTRGDLTWADRAASSLENEINITLRKDDDFANKFQKYTHNLRDQELDQLLSCGDPIAKNFIQKKYAL